MTPMNLRPPEEEYTAFQAKYVRLVPEGNIIEILTRQHEETAGLLEALTEEQGNHRYAEGKWSVKEVAGHISDNERIMSYRLLLAARGDRTPLPGYDQEVLMNGAPFENWSVSDVAADYSAARKSTLLLLRGLQDAAWLRKGITGDHEITARAWAYILAGHERHHLNILRERYLRT
jgi:hypothetical protein